MENLGYSNQFHYHQKAKLFESILLLKLSETIGYIFSKFFIKAENSPM